MYGKLRISADGRHLSLLCRNRRTHTSLFKLLPFIAVWLTVVCIPAGGIIPEAQQHFLKGLEYEKEGLSAEALDEYKKATNSDPEFADAYSRIALLELRKRKPYANLRAEQAIGKALRLEPDNPDYHVTHGKLLTAMGFRVKAGDRFNLALKLDPLHLDALMGLGDTYWDRWHLYTRTSTDSREAAPSTIVQSEKLLIIAFGYYKRILSIEPSHRNAFTKLFLIFHNLRRPDEIELLCKLYPEAWAEEPGDYIIDLQRALIHHSQYRFDQAMASFQKALRTMPAEEWAVYESIRSIRPPGEQEPFPEETGSDGTFDNRAAIRRDIFWGEKDPLYLTPVNERKLEHYRRIAYADLRFGDPLTGERGYETDRGRVYIRYGEPKQEGDIRLTGKLVLILPDTALAVLNNRPDIPFEELKQSIRFGYALQGWSSSSDEIGLAMEEITDSGNITILKSPDRIVWNYPEFRFSFDPENRYALRQVWSTSGVIYNVLDLKTAAKRMPELYEPDFQGEEFNLYGYYSTFRGQNGATLLDLCYAIPGRQFSYTIRSEKTDSELYSWADDDARLDRGLFIWDKDAGEVFRKLDIDSIATHGQSGDPVETALEYEEIVPLSAGRYRISMEARERVTMNTAVNRLEVVLPQYGHDSLQLSDILMADQIIPPRVSQYSREDIQIWNNPSRIFSSKETIHAYFEIYNLKPDPDGRTSYRIETTLAESSWIRSSTISRVIKKLSELFGGDSPRVYLGVSSDFRGKYDSQARYETVDISQLPPGRYKYHTRVVDLISGESAEKDFIFAVIPSLNFLKTDKPGG
ncbi:GWxTD domain-containing protein [candidate division KSB1 bacterium]